MKIGIDGRFLSGSISAGVPRYIDEICRCLDGLLPDATFFLYTQDLKGWTTPSNRWVVRSESVGWLRRIKPNIWLKFRMGGLCRQDKLDIFWGGCSLFPRLSRSTVKCLTVHDLNYLLVPETMSRGNRMAFSIFFDKDLGDADVIFCNSKGTAARLKKYFDRESDAIIYCSISEIFKPVRTEDRMMTLECYGLTFPYILSVGISEPRKNLLRLFEAVDQLYTENRLGGRRLVVVGRSGWKDEAVQASLKRYTSTWMTTLGYVDQHDLPLLYSGADLFVFPSIYEGFGMPALEARACGTQVVTTDIPELREAAGEFASYANDVTTIAIKEAILMGLDYVDSNVEKKMSAEPIKWPSWNEGAVAMATIFNQCLAKKRQSTPQ